MEGRQSCFMQHVGKSCCISRRNVLEKWLESCSAGKTAQWLHVLNQDLNAEFVSQEPWIDSRFGLWVGGMNMGFASRERKAWKNSQSGHVSRDDAQKKTSGGLVGAWRMGGTALRVS